MKIMLGILLLISTELLFSQGFDWQYSYRGHTRSPKLFLGLTSEYGLSFHTGSINFSEDLIPCCRFNTGNGSDFKIGVISEYWLYGGESSIIGALTYQNSNSSFIANPDPVYYLHDTLFTELEFKNSISIFQLSVLYKRRIDLSHFFIAGGIGIDFIAGNSYEHTERIVSSDLSFNDGSLIREIDNGAIGKLSKIIISPELLFGYDFNLGLGLYASVVVGTKINLNEVSAGTNWRKYSFSIGINILKGL